MLPPKFNNDELMMMVALSERFICPIAIYKTVKVSYICNTG